MSVAQLAPPRKASSPALESLADELAALVQERIVHIERGTALHLRPALTIGEAAQLIGVSDSHLRTFVRSGQLPNVRLGTVTLIRREALDAFLRNNEL